MITLTGVARFRVVEELSATTLFRQCRVRRCRSSRDFAPRRRGDRRPRRAVLKTFRAYLDAHNLEADWESVGRASNETLVNALAMMAPFDAAEKQALLEAPDLRARAETLVDLTEMSLARDIGGLAARCNERSRIARPDSIDPRLLEILVCPLTEDDAGI